MNFSRWDKGNYVFYVETSEILYELDVNVQCKMQYEEYETEKCSYFRISRDGTNEIYVFFRFYVFTSENLYEFGVNEQCKIQYEEYEMKKCSFFRISLDGTNEITFLR